MSSAPVATSNRNSVHVELGRNARGVLLQRRQNCEWMQVAVTPAPCCQQQRRNHDRPLAASAIDRIICCKYSVLQSSINHAVNAQQRSIAAGRV